MDSHHGGVWSSNRAAEETQYFEHRKSKA